MELSFRNARVVTGDEDFIGSVLVRDGLIVQVDRVVETGRLDPEVIVTPSIYVDRIVPADVLETQEESS